MTICKNIKDLILTDYLDAENGSALRENVDAHLRDCAECRAFAQEVEKTLAEPFAGAVREQVPEHLWYSIKDKIQQGSAPAFQAESFWNKLSKAFVLPKLAPAYGSFALILIFCSVVFFHQQAQQAKEKEQGEYLASLWATTDTAQDMGTPIEKYFL